MALRGRAYFFLLRSGTTVTLVGITASDEIGLLGDWSFLGFLASLPERWPLGMLVSDVDEVDDTTQAGDRHRPTSACLGPFRRSGAPMVRLSAHEFVLWRAEDGEGVRATTHADTLRAPASSKVRAAALSVAPVVMTSSTSAMSLPGRVRKPCLVGSKASLICCWRSSADMAIKRSVWMVRASKSCLASSLSCRAPSAVAWTAASATPG